MKRKTILTVVALSLASTLPGLAQSSTKHPVDSVKTKQLEDVQVTATRASARTPMTFTNISKGQLTKSDLGKDLPYLLLQTPSVIATSDPGTGIGYTYLRVRGVDAAGINVMTNGVPLNDSESQGVFWANMPNFSSNVQDAQLQRGVGTSSNGSAAFGASLNLRTDNFSLVPTAMLNLLGGSYGTFRREASASTGRIGGHWALEAKLGRMNTDGYVDRSGTEGRSYFVQGGYFGESTIVKLLAFGGKQRTGVAWNGLEPDQEAIYGRRYNSAGHVNPGSSPAEARYRYNTDNYEQDHYQLQLIERLSPALMLNVTGHYTYGYGFTDELKVEQKLSKFGLQKFTAIGADGQPLMKDGKVVKVKAVDLLRQKYLKNHFAGLIANLDYKSDRLEITGGLAGNHYQGDHYGDFSITSPNPYHIDLGRPYYEDRAHKTDLSGFVKGNYEVLPGLSLFADLQYRFINYKISGTIDHFIEGADGTYAAQQMDLSKDFSFFNPKGGIFYQFTPQQHVYASVAVAHREPNRTHYTDVSPREYPRAERLTDWEVGYAFRSRTFTAGLNLYYMDYQDQLVKNGQKSDVGYDLSVNVPRSYRMGAELSSSLQILPSLRWDLALGVSRNRIEDYTIYVWSDKANNNVADSYHDTPIAYSPNVTLSNALTFSMNRFEAALTSQFVGRQYLDNTGAEARSLPSYHVANLRLGYDLPVKFVKGWSLSLQINNLLNSMYSSNGWTGYSYDDKGGVVNYNGFYPQAGLNVLVGTTFTI